MKSPILRLSEALHEVAPTLRRTLGDAPVEEIASLLAETDGPTVMLFGTYNAGKSTLINALIGEDCAAVSSQPETSVVASYTWNGFTLLDTPGIDAPVEHEEISRDQLRRSDVVLFVLSADAPVEERAPYGEIARLLAGDKRVILILNTRGGHQETADAYQRLRERVLENLRAAGVTDAVPICLVNAKTMRRGREPGKSALLEHAGYPTLERELLDLLRGSSSFDRARARGRQLAALVEGGITQMEARPVSTEGRDLDQHAHQISAEQLRLEGDVELAIGREGNVLRADLHNAEDLDAVQDAWNRAAEALHERISQLIQGTSQRVGVEAASLEKRRMRGEAPVGGSPHDGTKSETGQADFMKSIGDVITMPSIKAAMNEELLSQGSSAVLHATKKYIPSLMKGIGPKTIEKISGKVAAGVGRGLGPAI